VNLNLLRSLAITVTIHATVHCDSRGPTMTVAVQFKSESLAVAMP
jgi:hypothetical protein